MYRLSARAQAFHPLSGLSIPPTSSLSSLRHGLHAANAENCDAPRASPEYAATPKHAESLQDQGVISLERRHLEVPFADELTEQDARHSWVVVAAALQSKHQCGLPPPQGEFPFLLLVLGGCHTKLGDGLAEGYDTNRLELHYLFLAFSLFLDVLVQIHSADTIFSETSWEVVNCIGLCQVLTNCTSLAFITCLRWLEKVPNIFSQMVVKNGDLQWWNL